MTFEPETLAGHPMY